MKIASTKERILQYLNFKGINRALFYKETGLKRGFLDGDKLNTSLPDTFITTIIAKYQDLDVKWLLTGEGEMIIAQKAPYIHGAMSVRDNLGIRPGFVAEKNSVYNPKVITVDPEGNENILFVPVKARAGYLSGYGDPEFISSLPAYRFPGVQNGTFRMFEVEGLSMHPTLTGGDIVICDWVVDQSSIRDERVYVIVSTAGVVIKRVINRLQETGVLILKSDNVKNKEDYPPMVLDASDIIEVWYCRRKVSADFSSPSDVYNRLTNLEADIAVLKNDLKKDNLLLK